jgi:hypothetical protein
MAGIRSDDRDHESNQDRSTIERVLIEELTASTPELAYRGHGQGAALAVGKIEAPLMRLRVVETQAQRLDVTRRTINLELYKIGATVPHLPDDGRPLVLDPFIRTGQGMHAPRQASLPRTDLEVEVVLAISFLESATNARPRSA